MCNAYITVFMQPPHSFLSYLSKFCVFKHHRRDHSSSSNRFRSLFRVCNAICNCYVRQWIICMSVTEWTYIQQFNNNNHHNNDNVQHLKYMGGLFACMADCIKPRLLNSKSILCILYKHNKVCIICSIAFMCVCVGSGCWYVWMFSCRISWNFTVGMRLLLLFRSLIFEISSVSVHLLAIRCVYNTFLHKNTHSTLKKKIHEIPST